MASPDANNPLWLSEDFDQSQSNDIERFSTEPVWVSPSAKGDKTPTRKSVHSVLKYKEPQNQSPSDSNSSSYDSVLMWFRVMHILSALLVLVAGGINAYFVIKMTLEWNECIIRIYTISFCIIMLLVEVELDLVVQQIKILRLWMFRGLFYGFIGLLTYREIGVNLSSIIAIALMVMGIVHIILAIFHMEQVETIRSNNSNNNNNNTAYREIPCDFIKSPDK